MNFMRVASILLLVQALVLAHFLIQLSDGGMEGHIPAQGGTVTYVQIEPPHQWGGAYGLLNAIGNNMLNVVAGNLTNQDLYYNDSDNNCSRTEVLASVGIIAAEDVVPITTAAADSILGFSTGNGFSITQMFDEQHDFELAGVVHTLWSTRTFSRFGTYIQGVGQANGSLVFVTKTVRNGQGFNGEDINFQLVLPPGTWRATMDFSDTCAVLDELILTEPNTTAPSVLSPALPSRVCVNSQTPLYAVSRSQRRFCSTAEVGGLGCDPLEGVDIQIFEGATSVFTGSTDASGRILFTPAAPGDHVMRLSYGAEYTEVVFRAQPCLDYASGFAGAQQEIIELPQVNITPGNFSFSAIPRSESPEVLEESLAAQFMLILWLSAFILVFASIGYYRQHKDDSPTLLKMRIWFLERK